MKQVSLIFLLFIIFTSCNTGLHRPTKLTSTIVNVLDSTNAAFHIIQDNQTDFFEQINILDMSIQTKTDLSNETRIDALKYYKAFLQTDVESFTDEEHVALNKLFIELKSSCDKLSVDIFPKQLKLIKTKSNHYGDGTYYTRDEAIIIPYQSLSDINSPGFKRTMYHELFHIYSRLHPKKQAELYALIGFETVTTASELAMVNNLKDKILLNPDGVNYAVKILLKNKDRYVSAFPIIFSNQTTYNPGKTNFFQYISFDLFEVKSNSGRFEVVSDAKGNSMLLPEYMNSFFDQIKDNTQYTIHPDEIMADNFMLLMQLRASKESKVAFSKEGEKLIHDVEQILAR